MPLLCSISNSSLFRPEKSISVSLTKLLYLKYKWHSSHKLSLSTQVQMSKQEPTYAYTCTHIPMPLLLHLCSKKITQCLKYWNSSDATEGLPSTNSCSLLQSPDSYSRNMPHSFSLQTSRCVLFLQVGPHPTPPLWTFLRPSPFFYRMFPSLSQVEFIIIK